MCFQTVACWWQNDNLYMLSQSVLAHSSALLSSTWHNILEDPTLVCHSHRNIGVWLGLVRSVIPETQSSLRFALCKAHLSEWPESDYKGTANSRSDWACPEHQSSFDCTRRSCLWNKPTVNCYVSSLSSFGPNLPFLPVQQHQLQKSTGSFWAPIWVVGTINSHNAKYSNEIVL